MDFGALVPIGPMPYGSPELDISFKKMAETQQSLNTSLGALFKIYLPAIFLAFVVLCTEILSHASLLLLRFFVVRKHWLPKQVLPKLKRDTPVITLMQKRNAEA
jgi:hypothetical protein